MTQRRVRVGALAGAVALGAASLLVAGCTPTPAAPAASAPASQPVPKAGDVTFYLSLPTTSATGLNTAAANVATPGSSDYRHFSSLDQAARRFGATDAQINAVASSVGTLGLRFTADPTRLFGRVTGSTSQWQAALGAPLSEQPGTASNPPWVWISCKLELGLLSSLCSGASFKFV